MLKSYHFFNATKKENLKIVTLKQSINQKCEYYFCPMQIANLQQVRSHFNGYMKTESTGVSRYHIKLLLMISLEVSIPKIIAFIEFLLSVDTTDYIY